jgi:hypothetical protein
MGKCGRRLGKTGLKMTTLFNSPYLVCFAVKNLSHPCFIGVHLWLKKSLSYLLFNFCAFCAFSRQFSSAFIPVHLRLKNLSNQVSLSQCCGTPPDHYAPQIQNARSSGPCPDAHVPP